MNPTRPDSATDPAPWLLAGNSLSAINHDDRLLDRLGRGERPDAHDLDPAARVLALWLREVDQAGGAR